MKVFAVIIDNRHALPHVLKPDLEAAYSRMATDETRESEALEWAEGTIGDVKDETR